MLIERVANRSAMTLIEILIVTSLIAIISVAIYSCLSSGIRVWQEANRLVVEEDIAIFFDKISKDLRNVYSYSRIKPHGDVFKFSFPTIVYTKADKGSGHPENAYIDQLGKVEYYFDPISDNIYRRQANYSQAISEKYSKESKIVGSVERIKFTYFVLTPEGEIAKNEILDYIPSAVEVLVVFKDSRGERSMRKFIDIPIGG
ncbi:MAG: prepilin-type N-terminal cleavage/methylation domain-containing protein [Candidatus Omnitrophica bacterium]|nr:prepilin-type N-terminal cleavage/methylation domain-containing protein [Candidatus Omnitrophota bacterium]MBU4333911.1 prepilin-type N-terminal cleavage/methylation domain-containing protein [Candidatus Omnitrophota bacterium]